MKKVLCLILALVMLLGILPVSATENGADLAGAVAVGGATGGSSGTATGGGSAGSGTATGGGSAGSGTAVGEGYVVSGKITLEEDAILEHGVLVGWICAYRYKGQHIDMELLGEGEFSTFFEGETDSFHYQLTVPKDAGEIVIAVRARTAATGTGAFRSNILSDYVYYSDTVSSLDYTDATAITVTGDRSGVDIPLCAGVGLSWQGKLPAEATGYSEFATISVEDKETGDLLASTNTYLYQEGSWENMVLPGEYSGKEVYLSYDLYYNDDVLYTEPLYINPDGSLAKTREDATCHILTGANSVTFTAGLKVDFTTGIRGKISFEEGCASTGYFSCSITAENVETGNQGSAHISNDGVGEYSYVLTLPEEGTYRVWARIDFYDENSNVSECAHYYTENGMVYQWDDAELIDTSVKNTGIDFEFKKTKTLQGKIELDGELICPGGFKPTFHIQSENGGYEKDVTVQEDLTFRVDVPVNIQGNCTAYLYVRTGSNIVSDSYHYKNEATGDQFDADGKEPMVFRLTTGDLIQGKVKLPDGVNTTGQKRYQISLATVNSHGNLYTKQNVWTAIQSGETETSFLFAVPKGDTTEYVLYSRYEGYDDGLYNDNFYYTGTSKSSISLEKSAKVTSGTKDIVFYAMKGVAVPVTITNPQGGEYLSGEYTIDFGTSVKRRYFYLSQGETEESQFVLSEEHMGQDAYVSYWLDKYGKACIYVNPDGSITNNKKEAVPHRISQNTALEITLSTDESLFKVPAIKGSLRIPESVYITRGDGTETAMEGSVRLCKSGSEVKWQSLNGRVGESLTFAFEPEEIGEYTLMVYLDGWSYDTNLICNRYMYYTGTGWSENPEDAKVIYNDTEQSIEVDLPALPAIKGTVDFSEDTYLEEELRYEITYTDVASEETVTKSGYINEAEDFAYRMKGVDGAEEYHVSLQFGSAYSGSYDTNIPYGKTYYYTEDGLAADESATRKPVKATEELILKIPVAPTIKGTVVFPEDTAFSGTGSVCVDIFDENGSRIRRKDYQIDKAEDIPFAIAAGEEGKKYGVSVSFYEYDCETNLESGTLYYTKEGMTSSNTQRTCYPLKDLDGVRLHLRQKRYITGKLAVEDLVNYDETISATAEFQTDRMGMSRQVSIDDQLNYKVEIPSDIDGEFYFGLSFQKDGKNNLIKEESFYYADGYGEKKKISYPDFTNINVIAETGYIFSGVVKLPTDAVVYENQDISGAVYLGSAYRSNFNIPYGEREGEFFMVIPKTGYSGFLYTSGGNRFAGKSENLYPGQVYYKDKNTSVVSSEKAEKIKVEKEIEDAVLMLVTGEVYQVAFTKPAEIATAERVYLYGKIGDVALGSSAKIEASDTGAEVSVVVPPDYQGEQMLLYYDLDGDNANALYRERVYINPDGSLAGSKKLAETFEIGKGSEKLSVTLAEDADLAFPEYIYRSPYPYKNYGDNRFFFEYTLGDCDYLKVTFAEETNFASSYSGQDTFAITYGDNESMGPYDTSDLSGKTLNIPGNFFEGYITEQALTSAFGFAIESIEPKKYILETSHPYQSSEPKEYPYTHGAQAEGLRLHFSEDTNFSGTMKINYTQNGEDKTLYKSDYDLAGKTIDVRGNSFTITLPADVSGSCYGFTIVEIEELSYADVTFQNYDGTVMYQTEVEKGKDVSYRANTPVRERDEDYIYLFEGWDKPLENIQEDIVFTAQFSENPYATVVFKNSLEDEEILYTDYVILGENASFEGEVPPSKPTDGTCAYVFTGWSGSLSRIKEDTVLTAEFEACEILLQSEHPYAEEEIKTYTYEGSADCITLYFSSDSKIDESDELLIYDEQDNVQYVLTGYLGGRGYTIPGKTAKIQIVNNYGGAFGYALVKAVPMWHQFSDWYVDYAPTCNEEGSEYRWCPNCYQEENRVVPPLGHSFGVWQEDADGAIFRECIRCAERELFAGDVDSLGVVNITVVDGVTLEPIPDATITAYDENNNETVWHTNKEGVGSQLLPQGVNNLVVFAEDYGMRNFSVTIDAGVTNLPVVGLTRRPAVECDLVAKIMDMEEIKAAGIDITDPSNSHVYKYKIDIGFGESTYYFNKDGEYIKRDGDIYHHKDERTGETVSIHPVNDKYYLIIYGQAKWMKEMFDVELMAVNTSNTDRVEDLVAELNIPAGMSLAAMNTVPQKDVQRMDSLASGERKSVHWYVRGDQAGEYHLSAKLTGTMMPFGDQFGYEYTTEDPVRVYAGNALKMNIVVPAVATYGEDYTVRIELENVSDRSVYNLSNSIDKILQSKFLTIDAEGNEKYFEENALGSVAVDELKPGEKIVAELKSNILFESDTIKGKISTLADRLREETDVLAVFNGFKATLDLFNDNYDILDKAYGHVLRGKEYLSGEERLAAEELESVLNGCKDFVKTGSSSRAMYFLNHLKQEDTMEEIITLSKDANFYTVWTKERMGQLSAELKTLHTKALKPENCSDYDVYGDIKKVLKAIPVNFWFKNLFVSTMEGSTTSIPYSVTILPSSQSNVQITNISNYYYNILTDAIDMLSQPWYAEIMGEVRDTEGVEATKEIIKTDVEKSLTFAVTDVSGDTRFHAWVEGEAGKKFSVSSSAEGEEITEGGVTFTGPAYLSVSATEPGSGTLYLEPVGNVATYSADANRYSFAIEAVAAHQCGSEKWVELVTPYDGQDGYQAKYCDTCQTLVDVRTVDAKDDCSLGSYRITDEVITEEEYQCNLVFDGEIPARSAMAILVLEDANGVMAGIGKDDIKIKPASTVQVKIPIKNADKFQPKLFLWDNFTKLRPVGTLIR